MKKLLDLLTIVHGLESGDVSPEEASEFMQSKEVQKIIHRYLDKFDKDDDSILGEDEIQELKDIVSIAYYIFTYSGENTGLSDTEYDKLFDLMSKYGNEFVTLATPENVKESEHHSYPMLRGTLAKVHYLTTSKDKVNDSRRTLDQWIFSKETLYYNETGEKIDLKSCDVYVFPKWDGVSVVFEFDENGNLIKALTRGYTKFNTAESVGVHFRDLKRPLHGKKYGQKTEILVTEDSLIDYNEKYKKDYKQSRSIASGIINSDEAGEKDNYLVIMQLRYIEEGNSIEKLCPEVFDHPYIKCKLGNTDAIEEFAQSHRFVDGLRCDGVVIHIIDPKIQEILGRKDDKNNFEVAYKFTEEFEMSKVEGIDFQVGLFGRITPVVRVKPIKLKGNTITSASLGSVKRMEYLSLAKGDTIKIFYDIIPYALFDEDCKRSGNDPIKLDMRCPSCGSDLVRDGAIVSCENPDCACRKKGRILNYLVKMNIQGLSYSTIDILYDCGIVKSIKDLYSLDDHKKEIISIPGFGKTKYKNWIEEISSKKDVPESLLFGAVGIPGCSQKTFEKIFCTFTADDLFELANNDSMDSQASLQIVDGIGEKKSSIILKGIKDNEKLLKFLVKTVGIVHQNELLPDKFRVCFTKIRDPEIEQEIIRLGGRVVDNITSTTTFCVVPELGVSSGKTKLAKEKGIDIIPIDDIIAKIHERFKI